MGVKGLWQLLMPIGRRISMETLEGQTLAVDASIWLIQFLAVSNNNYSSNDDDMNDTNHSYKKNSSVIIGFLRRICKLLYHGIRPVFVFDGMTPQIKLREIQLRRKRRHRGGGTWLSSSLLETEENGDEGYKRAAKRILMHRLKSISTTSVPKEEEGKEKEEERNKVEKKMEKKKRKAVQFVNGENYEYMDASCSYELNHITTAATATSDDASKSSIRPTIHDCEIEVVKDNYSTTEVSIQRYYSSYIYVFLNVGTI